MDVEMSNDCSKAKRELYIYLMHIWLDRSPGRFEWRLGCANLDSARKAASLLIEWCCRIRSRARNLNLIPSQMLFERDRERAGGKLVIHRKSARCGNIVLLLCFGKWGTQRVKTKARRKYLFSRGTQRNNTFRDVLLRWINIHLNTNAVGVFKRSPPRSQNKQKWIFCVL